MSSVGIRNFDTSSFHRISRSSSGAPPESACDPELGRLEKLAHWLDDGYHLGGIRFGWDAIAKLIPVFGDTLSAIVSLYLFQAFRQFNLPRVTRTRMAVNIGIDYVVGMIPIIGTIFDVFWKPNVWNVGLVRRHLAATSIAETRRGHRNDSLYLATIALIGVLLFVAAVAATVWLVSRLVLLIEGA